MKAQFVYENLNFERRKLTPEVLGIGNKEYQAKNRIKEFAEENGWEYNETSRGVQSLTKPLVMEVPHNFQSSGPYLGNKKTFVSDAIRYKIAWLDSWIEPEGTPLSLRKVYMRKGKETKQNLMGRFPDAHEVIRRILINHPKELKKANLSESINFEKGKDPKETLRIGTYSKLWSELEDLNGPDGFSFDEDVFHVIDNTYDPDNPAILAKLKKLLDKGSIYKESNLEKKVGSDIDTTEVVLYQTPAGPVFSWDFDYGIGFGTPNEWWPKIEKALLEIPISMEELLRREGVNPDDPEEVEEFISHYKEVKKLIPESVNFERGRDPKEAMRIGALANPLDIVSMEEEQWEGGRVMSMDDVEKVNQNTWMNPLDDDMEIRYILSHWEDEIDPFYGFWVKEEDEDPEWYHPSDLEGRFVKYGEEIFKIPETNIFKND